MRLFASLGMSDIPRPDDVLRYVDQLIEEAKGSGASAVAERIIGVFEHLQQHWTELGTAQVTDRQIGGRVLPLNQALSARAWLPAQRDPKRLARYPGFVIPDDRLYRAEELQFARNAHLVASQCPIAYIERELPTGDPERPRLCRIAAPSSGAQAFRASSRPLGRARQR